MSSAMNLDVKQLFAQVLKNPNSVSDEEFDFLLDAYPYAQSLSFARQRRTKFSENQQVDVSQKALLHTDNAYWLYEFVNEMFVVEEQEVGGEPVFSSETNEEKQEITAKHTENKELEELILGQMQSADYFALEEVQSVDQMHSAEAEEAAPFLPDVVKSEVEKDQINQEQDDVSVYDDALMPYSFRWWLYKTRLAHADTYQPFVTKDTLLRTDAHIFQKNFDETILDHQIRENIFHLQNPEDKLSDAVKQKTVEVVLPKRTDAIIERFIREEPQIQPPTPDVVNNENKARKSAEDRFSLVTETLANIYIEQGLYPKAIDVFRKLISINPEKKLYFASRIEELEQKT
ncbi:tetratricopeptide repeat protein [Sphingobacterium corticis]|uniref:Tetratricopeptide repeat protein n=1 Tax=Sphingobacterium corticis TaxID=1812823 RepID=A0ABW5NPS9_9SPHI